jgi:hypothetical protein
LLAVNAFMAVTGIYQLQRKIRSDMQTAWWLRLWLWTSSVLVLSKIEYLYWSYCNCQG